MPKISPLILLMMSSTSKDDEELDQGETRKLFLTEAEMDEFLAKKPAIDSEMTAEGLGPQHLYNLHGPQGQVAKALGITTDELAWAKKVGHKYPGGLHGQGDAARHLALGWLAEQSANPKLAHALASLRELLDSTEGARMDRHNNDLGKKLEAANYQEAEAAIEQCLKDGSAKYHGKRYGEE